MHASSLEVRVWNEFWDLLSLKYLNSQLNLVLRYFYYILCACLWRTSQVTVFLMFSFWWCKRFSPWQFWRLNKKHFNFVCLCLIIEHLWLCKLMSLVWIRYIIYIFTYSDLNLCFNGLKSYQPPMLCFLPKIVFCICQMSFCMCLCIALLHFIHVSWCFGRCWRACWCWIMNWLCRLMLTTLCGVKQVRVFLSFCYFCALLRLWITLVADFSCSDK